jgi:hypothetical protein
MNSQNRHVITGLSAVLVFAIAGSAAEPTEALRARGFRLSYTVTITELQPAESANLWLPVPPNNDEQRVHVVAQNLPGPSQQSREKKYANDFSSWGENFAGLIEARPSMK